ncbi:DUF4126 domain-containing protein [Serinibacter arcticus]|uniref:DUF4126 domain-containing protein n=1 Tax=Serinibacter arcticus TaxID=1655435 RepID=A0A2U1ZZF8_9MICO|nr:DUF4126 domain-containing protein [Serinibacter arcticus]PWD52375.1 DUF4126 domain-containing protein [Serinibacter arcticus]
MLELLTGLGLASASGLNAYVPLLALGLLGRFTDVVTLPAGWAWLENPWLLIVLGVLCVVDVVADKIPAVDSVNDVVQTLVRPASGGIVFASGVGTETVAVSDPGAMFADGRWIPVVIGVVVALVVHLTKAGVRPVANVATAGVSAPVLSTVEDATSLSLVAAAILLPVLVLVLLGGVVGAGVVLLRRRRRSRAVARPRSAPR